MNKTTPFLAFILLSSTLIANAQTFYLEQNGNILEDSSVITMDADQDSIYTFNLIKPDTEWESVTWNINGGLTLISKNDSSISVKCADGESYSTKYSKYSAARITVHASKLIDDEIPDGCADCAAYSDCNPDYSTTILIYKTFDWSNNAIVGNDCITAGDSVTFSVAPWVSLLYVAGGDTYYWNIPDNLIDSDLYYSADGSSVTFVASENIEGQTISVEIGKYNLDSGQEPLTFTLGRKTEEPEIEDMIDDAYCLPFDTDTFSLSVTNASEDATYDWNVKGWTITEQNDNGSQITICPDNNEQMIYLTVISGCSTDKYYYEINRSLSENYKITTDNDNAYCLTSGSYQQFYIDEVPIGTEMTWTVAGEGWNISSDQSIKARPYITVGTTTGIITAYCTNCSDISITDTFYIAPAELGNISGTTCIVQGTTSVVEYSVDAVEGADYYEWIYPSGWTIDGDSTINKITFISDGVTIDTIKVRGVGCNYTEWSTLLPKRIYNTPIGISSDCINVGLGGYTYLYVEEDGSADEKISYTWNIPSEFGYIKSYATSTKSQVRVYCYGDTGTYEISVTANNECSTDASYSTTIKIEETATIQMTLVGSSFRYFTLNDSNEENAVQYDWYLNESLSQSGTDDAFVVFESNDAYYSGSLYVIITYSDGCKIKLSIEWDDTETASATLKGLALSSEFNSDNDIILNLNSSPVSVKNELTAYPNPTNGTVTINIPNNLVGGTLFLVDMFGQILKQTKISNSQMKLDISTYKTGIYAVYAVFNGNTKTVKITKQ